MTDGVQVVLDRYNKVLALDTRANTVTVQGGCTIAELNRRLTPALEELAAQSEQMAEVSTRLDARRRSD